MHLLCHQTNLTLEPSIAIAHQHLLNNLKYFANIFILQYNRIDIDVFDGSTIARFFFSTGVNGVITLAGHSSCTSNLPTLK